LSGTSGDGAVESGHGHGDQDQVSRVRFHRLGECFDLPKLHALSRVRVAPKEGLRSV
jgi:hypothetical protein